MPGTSTKRSYGSWVFLALTLIAYALLGILKPQAAIEAFNLFTRVFNQVYPVLGLVFLLLLAANLLLEPKRIKRYLGKGSGLKGWSIAIAGGVLSIGSIYPWYAMLSELQKKGMRTELLSAFLYSRAIKLPMLPLMIHYFGAIYTLLLCLYIIVFSIINGILLEKLTVSGK
ncbi:MAG: permease [Gammaproteobacteria bacterium]|nr:permease [Gammaproteobacteria bacterium]